MLLKDHRVEEKQSFKRLSVYISIKYRKLQSIKKLFIPFNFFAQTAFLIDFSIHFICRRYFYPYFYPVVKRNKKIFYFISFEVIKIKNVLKLRILLYFSSNKISIPLVSPLGYRPTRIYSHQKRPFSGYKPWVYIHYFTVSYLPFLTLSAPGYFCLITPLA